MKARRRQVALAEASEERMASGKDDSFWAKANESETANDPGSGPGEFTRLFQAINAEATRIPAAKSESSGPAAPQDAAREGASSSMESREERAGQETASRPFATEPIPAKAFGGPAFGTFKSAPPFAPTAPSPGAPASAPATAPSEISAPAAKQGDLTQVFQPLSRPASAPPISGAAGEVPADAGQFTRMFSSLSGGAAAASSTAAPGTPPMKHAEPLQPPASEAFRSPASPAVPAFAAQPPAPGGAFTQMFSQLQPGGAAAPPGADSLPAAPPPPAPGRGEPGEFTRVFSQPKANQFQASPGQADRNKASESNSAAASGGENWSFAAKDGGGAFERLEAPPAQSPAPPQILTPLPAPVAEGGGFTQLFGALAGTPSGGGMPGQPMPGHSMPPASSPSAAGGGLGAPAPFSSGPAPGLGTSPFGAPAASAPAGGGDFTRLMRSLDQSAQPAQPAPGASAMGPAPLAAPGGDPSFFSQQASGSSSAGEFTRVMRGASPAASATPASVTPPAAVTPGMAIAPARDADAGAKSDAKEKPKKLVLLLVVINVVLVLALLVLALLFLRHH